MKEKHALQHAGLWLDGNHAMLVANAPGNETEDFMIEARVTRPEHTDSGSEHTRHQSRQADDAHYFKELSAKLLSYDEILIFGPGNSQEQFHNFLKEDNHFRDKKITISSSDKLSDEKMIHRVKSFFAPNTF
jgi:stalled ribosome rescue protein Dom34